MTTQDTITQKINEILEKRNDYIEKMAMAYLKLTNIHPTEAELVEDRRGLQTVWYFRKRDNDQNN